MVSEVVTLIEAVPAGTFVDATRPDLSLLGIDQDADARQAATRRLAAFGQRVDIVGIRFDELQSLLDRFPDSEVISGFLFDLGVSSPQLDRSDRGFSFRNDGPLDMRMDRTSTLTAADVVNNYDERSLADVLRRYGDERFARRIAAMIVGARPLTSTGQLAAVVVNAIPAAARRTGGHPAKRTFQAIRIEVNDELGALRSALQTALDAVSPGGRVLVLTYHSGEDRIVKSAFRDRTTSGQPPGLPVEVDPPDFSIVRPMARRPTADEQNTNPRARSARLRAIERVAA